MKSFILVLALAVVLFTGWTLWKQVEDCREAGATFDFMTNSCV